MTAKSKKGTSRVKRSSKLTSDAPSIPNALLEEVKRVKTAGRQGRRQRLRHSKRYNQEQNLSEYIERTEEFAGNLIARFARTIGSAFRSAAVFDWQMIVDALAMGDPESKGGPYNWPQRQIWEKYAHHFQSSAKRRALFAAIESNAKRFHQDIIFCQAHAALHGKPADPPDLLWDDTLLPYETAPHLLRQWTRDRTRTQTFLTRLFHHFAGFKTKGSTGRRALILANTLAQHSWKPQLMVEKLEQTGDVRVGSHEYEVDRKLALERQAGTIGRSIRRIRGAAEDWVKKRERRLARAPIAKRNAEAEKGNNRVAYNSLVQSED
jgi:hypothetical protein